MDATVVLDKKAEKELTELSKLLTAPKSKVVKTAVDELYFKEKRARKGFRFFMDQYNKGIITRDALFLLLPREDAEAIIIGSATGKEAAAVFLK